MEYTLDRWDAEKAEKYVLQLEQCLLDLASGRRIGKDFNDEFPEVSVLHCEHHYVFYLGGAHPTTVLAMLHEAMDLVSRLKERVK